jgi:hypothetical protein
MLIEKYFFIALKRRNSLIGILRMFLNRLRNVRAEESLDHLFVMNTQPGNRGDNATEGFPVPCVNLNDQRRGGHQ